MAPLNILQSSQTRRAEGDGALDVLSEKGQGTPWEVHFGFRDVTSVPILQVTVLGLPCPYGLVFVRGQRGVWQADVSSETSTFSSCSICSISSVLPLQEQSLGYQLCAGLHCKNETFASHQGPQHPHCSPSRAWAEEQLQKWS